MTVSIDIEVARNEDALVVPIGSVLALASPAPYVFTVEKRRVVRRELSTGIRDSRYVEVRSGLAEGDLVLLHPGSLRLGDRVRVEVDHK
jgi:HlyD family secretion protein